MPETNLANLRNWADHLEFGVYAHAGTHVQIHIPIDIRREYIYIYMATDFYSVFKSVENRGGAYEGAWKSGGGKNQPSEERHLKSVRPS
jgi:hypothetical protein